MTGRTISIPGRTIFMTGRTISIPGHTIFMAGHTIFCVYLWQVALYL
jgi:hypothetical protein